MNLSTIFTLDKRDLEVFLPVKGYEGLYEISNYGRVISCERKIKKVNRWGKYLYTINRKEIKPIVSKRGYYRVNLYNNKRQKLIFIHRLVASAFLPNPLNLPLVKHLDNNPQNNHTTNLEWSTQSSNIQQAYDEKRAISNWPKGEKHRLAKLTNEIVLMIRSSSLSGLKLAMMYKVNPSTIYAIKCRKIWKNI